MRVALLGLIPILNLPQIRVLTNLALPQPVSVDWRDMHRVTHSSFLRFPLRFRSRVRARRILAYFHPVAIEYEPPTFKRCAGRSIDGVRVQPLLLLSLVHQNAGCLQIIDIALVAL